MGVGASGIFEIGRTPNAHHRASNIRKIANLEVNPVSNLHRKHPVSIAVTMALLSAAATSAMASDRVGAENEGAQGPAQQDAPPAPSPGARGVDASTVTAYAVRQSQRKA